MESWQHSIFGCFSNLGLCIITYFAPCYTFGKNAEVVGEGCCFCGCMYLVPGVNYFAMTQIRGMIRSSRNIAGSICEDLLLVLLCPFCTLIQEAKEIRGYDSLDMVRA